MKLSDKILLGFLALMITGALGIIIAFWTATTIPAKQIMYTGLIDITYHD
jgi:hypothetical protein